MTDKVKKVLFNIFVVVFIVGGLSVAIYQTVQQSKESKLPVTLSLEKYEVAALLESNNFGLLNKSTMQIDYVVKDSLLQVIYMFYATQHQDSYVKSINKK